MLKDFKCKGLYTILTIFTFCLLTIQQPIANAQSRNIVIENEWWIQVDIFTKKTNQDLNDELLVHLYNDIIEEERDSILSWHFFREFQLRFRIETINEEQRSRIADRLSAYLNSFETVVEWYYANHNDKVDDLVQGYDGEQSHYKRMWPYQKKIWEWGSEMTIAAINEEYEIGINEPSRNYQLTRTYHLLANQLSLGYDVWYCFSLNNNGSLLVWASILISFILGFRVSEFVNRKKYE